MPEITRRKFTLGLSSGVAMRAASEDWNQRPGVLCQLGSSESEARQVIDAAAQAGFRSAMVNFAWDRVDAIFLRSLPGWMRSSGMQCDALGAYVNCVSPGAVLMNTRAGDFVRALSYATELGGRRLVAWTGSHLAELMKSDARNASEASEEALVRFIEPHCARLESSRLTLCLETYITLTCPDAASLKRVLARLPNSVAAVLDPPNLTPIARYENRDEALREMFKTLSGRIGLVHLKDFRLNASKRAYDLPGPLKGEMNYPLFAELICGLPQDIPVVAEHIGPAEFAPTRQKLLPLFAGGSARTR